LKNKLQNLFLLIMLVFLFNGIFNGPQDIIYDYIRVASGGEKVALKNFSGENLIPLNGECLFSKEHLEDFIEQKIQREIEIIETNQYFLLQDSLSFEKLKCWGRISGSEYPQSVNVNEIDNNIYITVQKLNIFQQFLFSNILIFFVFNLIFKNKASIKNLKYIAFSTLIALFSPGLVENLTFYFQLRKYAYCIILVLLINILLRNLKSFELNSALSLFILQINSFSILYFAFYVFGANFNHEIFIYLLGVTFYLNLYFKIHKLFDQRVLFFISLFFIINLPNNLAFDFSKNWFRNVNYSSEKIQSLESRNVVHVIFDTFSSSNALKVPINDLEGLQRVENFYSTGPYTVQSLVDMFNGDTWNGDLINFQEYRESVATDRNSLINKLNNNNVNTYLFVDDLSFSYVNEIYSSFKFKNVKSNKDLVPESWVIFDNKPKEDTRSSNNVFTWSLRYSLNFLNIKDFDYFDFQNPQVPIQLLQDFSDEFSQTSSQGLNYYFLHLLMPHEPYKVDSFCNYLDQIQQTPKMSEDCAVYMIETLVDFINASNKETLVIIHGDTSNYEDEDITTLETLKDVDKEDLQLFFQKRVDIGFLIINPQAEKNIFGLGNKYTIFLKSLIEEFLLNNSIPKYGNNFEPDDLYMFRTQNWNKEVKEYVKIEVDW